MMQTSLMGAALAALISFSCGSAKSSAGPCPSGAKLLGDEPPNGTLTWCAKEDGSKHGPWTEWYEGGSLKRTGRYTDGKMQGRWVSYHPASAPQEGEANPPTKKEEGDYKAGLKIGVWTTWHEDGAKSRESEHEPDSPVVKWTAWKPDGAKWAAGKTVSGREHGAYSEWHPNGKVSVKGNYENGEKAGQWEFWDEEGKPTADPSAASATDPAAAPATP